MKRAGAGGCFPIATDTGVDVTGDNGQTDQALPLEEANLDAALPGDRFAADKRSGQRFTLMLRFAKLKCADREFLCVIRNLSANGASVKLFHPLHVTGPVEIEMPNGQSITADMVWQREDKAGFHFHQEADLASLIEGSSLYPKRGMRVAVTIPVELCFDGRVVDAVITNLSQQGAFVSCDERLPLLQQLTLRNPFMPEIRAKVRWRHESGSGLVFDDTFHYADLARLVDSLQLHYAAQNQDLPQAD